MVLWSQVRPELRNLIPDSRSICNAVSGGEGTLSVAGSPQPYKPVAEEPSVITRMPHMINQYRFTVIYST